MTHGIERTSPKGGPFLGMCRYCGAENLPMRAALEPCPKAPTQDAQIIDALNYGKEPSPAPLPDKERP
jgi:hypothetical protein